MIEKEEKAEDKKVEIVDSLNDSQGDSPLDANAEITATPLVTQTEQNEQTETEPKEIKFYDLVYGVLFDATNTFRRVATNPPVGLTVTLILGLNIILAIMGMVTTSSQPLVGNMMGYANQQLISTMQSVAPIMAMLGFIINALIWVAYSGMLHLIAEFYGGRGRAITTFTVYGLAGLPALFLLPLQGMEIIFAESAFFNILSVIGTVAVTIWGIILLVIGLREVHYISTGKAVLVVVTPWLIGLLLAVTIIITMVGVISSALPYLEQLGRM